MITPNLTQFATFILALSRRTFGDRSARSRGLLLVCMVCLAVLCPALATSARGQVAAPWALLWYSQFTASPGESRGDSGSVGEQVTLDEAMALALDANRLAKNPERLRLVAESVKHAYAGVLRAQRALEIREEALTTCRDLHRLVAEQADGFEAAPSAVLHAKTARARATNDVLSARLEFRAWARQLNHLMGRDPQAPLRVSPEPGRVPGVTATGQ